MAGQGASRGPRRSLAVPAGFDFRATVWSHGWCALAPFRWDPALGRLERALRLPRGTATVALTQPGGRGAPVAARVVAGRGSRGGLGATEWRAVERDLVTMLRLDQDLDAFHAACRRAGPPFDRAPADAFGRLLRAPTVFEDVVKILATTNTAWRQTKGMVANLVALTGGPAFPAPAEVAALGEPRLRAEGRWGYRAPFLARLAELAAGGTVDLESWPAWKGTTEELAEEVRRLPGVGPYAAASLLVLLGRFDRIGVDTVFRTFVRKRYFPRARRALTDRRMLQVYDRWGEWRALAYWYELWSDYDDAGGEVLAPVPVPPK